MHTIGVLPIINTQLNMFTPKSSKKNPNILISRGMLGSKEQWSEIHKCLQVEDAKELR